MVVLRRRGLAKALPDAGAIPEEAAEQLVKLRVLNRFEQLSKLLLEPFDGDLGPADELVPLDLVRRCRANLVDLDLGAVLLVDGKPPADVRDRARLRCGEGGLDVVPGDRRDAAGAVGQDEAQVLIALSSRAAVSLPNDERTGDRLPVGQVTDAHPGAGGSRVGTVAGDQRRSLGQ